MKIQIKKSLMKKLAATFLEKTPPHVKSSEQNMKVAKVMLAIDSL